MYGPAQGSATSRFSGGKYVVLSRQNGTGGTESAVFPQSHRSRQADYTSRAVIRMVFDSESIKAYINGISTALL